MYKTEIVEEDKNKMIQMERLSLIEKEVKCDIIKSYSSLHQAKMPNIVYIVMIKQQTPFNFFIHCW